jgi:hypothetical protein
MVPTYDGVHEEAVLILKNRIKSQSLEVSKIKKNKK